MFDVNDIAVRRESVTSGQPRHLAVVSEFTQLDTNHKADPSSPQYRIGSVSRACFLLPSTHSIPSAPKVCFAVLAVAHVVRRARPLADRAIVQMWLELGPSHLDLFVAAYAFP